MGVAVLGGLIGLALVVFGARMLIVRRAPAMISRSFRTVREAGWYHLLFGLALLLFVFGGAAASLIAVALVGIAVLRFRPRGHKADDE